MSRVPALRCFLVAIPLLVATAQGRTVYVSTGGNDGNDGLSWAAAKKTVTAGLNTAASGDQVWVAAGTYVERITLAPGVELYGGFAGGETDLSQRIWRTNVTVLDGNQGGRVVMAPTAATRIDGFTIRNGKSSSDGGGIYCYSSSPTIANNTITGNTAYSYGGGIYCSSSSSSPTITNNTITGNTANSSGGGIYCNSSSLATIVSNTISGNTASAGGGIYCDSSSPIIASNTITGNTASSYGGGVYCNSSSPTIANNTITRNTATSYGGGGIYCNSSSPTIASTIIAFNSSGIYRSSGTPTLRYCCVYGNTAYNYSGLTDPTGTNGNISADPQLADVARGNLHLQPTSPCVNAGDDTAVQAGWSDIDGQARVQGTHVDIGADESDGTLWPAAAAVLYVSSSGSDSNDGLSWATAKRTLQAGIDTGGSGSQVWVAAGTYVGTIRLGFGMALYGGFSGSETGLSQRNWRTNVTILDGNQGGSVVTAPMGATTSTQIDGFTIRNGKATSGGGIYCYYSSPTITNNTITGNSGSGIYCSSSSPTIANNTITGNTATSGGGICCSSASPTITNNTVAGNTATSYGGGIYCFSASSPTIAGNTITGNTGSYGGGIYCDSFSPMIASNTITGNRAYYDGGGIYCASYSSAMITNNTITGNTASNNGGGIYCAYSSATIAGNTITGNMASSGGGIYCYYSSPTIVNTIVAFNSSGISGAPTLRYCCVYGNSAYNYSGLTDPTGTNGNISVDPQLADVARGNMHLQPGSPCMNTGDDAAVQAGCTDIDGQARVQRAHVDIGADESDGTLWPTAPAILFVSPSGSDSNDGLSWVSAKRTVQAAVDAGGTGSQVWVAAGTYVGTIRLGFGMSLYGGFAGSETDLSQRNWQTNVTTLDGNQGGSVVTAPLAAAASTRIDGFTVRNGKATSGGGIYCYYSSPTITNNTITGNSGSGIYCSYYSSPTITNNTITGNSSSGISCYKFSSPTITNNTITSNTASNPSGGIYGGGIYCFSASSPTITNNTITGNTALHSGGGICCDSSSPTIVNNTIAGNTASNGGGIYSFLSSTTISNNTITSNTASSGGGIYCTSSPTITNNTITGNTATYGGGGIECNTASATIANNTITGNTATYGGGGIYCSSSSPTITNTIIVFNSSGISTDSVTPTLRYCCVYGNSTYNYSGLSDPTGTNGNISVNPLFVLTPNAGPDGKWATADDLRGDLHLTAGSPCVNMGDPAYVPAAAATDLDGRPRVLYARVDIGAYEYQKPGDVNYDGLVNVSDLQGLVTGWASRKGQAGWTAGADINHDGYVNVGDLQILIANWGL